MLAPACAAAPTSMCCAEVRRMQTQMTLSKSIKHRDVVPEVK